jgi:hypothetical protein
MIGRPTPMSPLRGVSMLDIGAGEDEGELAVLADLRSEMTSTEEQPGTKLPLVLGVIGVVLGGAALIVALTRSRGAMGPRS